MSASRTIHRLRLLAGRLAIILVLLLAVEPILRSESQVVAARPLTRPVEQASRPEPLDDLLPLQAQQAQTVGARDPLQSVQESIDLAVRRSLAVLGWQVTALDSQLNDASLQE
jgi:hypothetical protein